jgi:acetyltransferase-like isoleucine patch superfamily enzyme
MLILRERLPIRKILLLGFLPSFIKVWYYRLKGGEIGKNVRIAFGAVIEARTIEIADSVSIGFATVISGREVRIGSHSSIGSLVFIDVPVVRVGQDVVIREFVHIGGNETQESSFSIGDRSHIRQSCNINTSKPVEIGNETAIGGGTSIFTHSSWQSACEGYPCTYSPVRIGDNVWIGWHVFVMPGTQIGDGVLVTAGSVVTQSVAPRSLVSGNPAKVVIQAGQFPRALETDEKDEKLKEILRGFFDYLRFHHGVVNSSEGECTIDASIAFEDVSVDLRYCFENRATIENLPATSQGVYVGLHNISRENRLYLLRNNWMVLNLETMERFGENDIGEETIQYLLKFGLKFKRALVGQT